MSAVAPAAVAGAPPAYPQPITLPPSPRGDPDAARRLAAACRELAASVDDCTRRAVAVLDGLHSTWRGTGSTTLRTAADTVASDAARVSRGLRTAADHLDDFAHRLEHAQHHHHWSLGRLLAVGAVVAVTATAVVVTAGAAAPVGSVAAAEVGAAVAAAEGAAAAAGAAESAAVAALGDCAALFRGLRLLRAVLGRHLVQGAIASGLDAGGELARGRRVDAGHVLDAFALGTVTSAGTTAALRSVIGSSAYAGWDAMTRLAATSATAGGAQAAIAAARQYAETGRVDIASVGEVAGAGAAMHAWPRLPELDRGISAPRLSAGGAAVALQGTSRAPLGQTPDELLTGRLDLARHEGGRYAGHTLAKHVARSAPWLRDRMMRDQLGVASSFFDKRSAEAAITRLLQANEDDVRAYLRPGATRKPLHLRGHVGEVAGHVQFRNGRRLLSDYTCVELRRHQGRLVIVTAYLDRLPAYCFKETAINR